MTVNSITEEIRKIRHRLAAAQGNDVFRIGEELRRREQESGRNIVRLPKREPAAKTKNHVLHGRSGRATTLHNESTPGTP
jgi:hypothetical protein